MQWKLPEIGVLPEKLFPGAPDFLTNTFLTAIITALIVIGLFLTAANKPRIVPGPLQNLVEWAFQLILNLCEGVAGKRRGRLFYPWVAAIFFYALIANWWDVIPGVDTLGVVNTKIEGCQHATGGFLTGPVSNCVTPWLRPPSTDLNFTLALAVVTVIITQGYGFYLLGVRAQIGRYLTFNEGPIRLIVGILEFFLELLRLLSLSFRLFGNVFAGDVLLLVMGFLTLGIAAIPFYFLEVFVGFIQAFVFAFLTLIFLTLGSTGHGGEEHGAEHIEGVRQAEHAATEAALAR